MNLANVKRATKGQFVKADVTGTDVWMAGKITTFNKTHISFIPADAREEEIKIGRAHVFKADLKEYEADFVDVNDVEYLEAYGTANCPNCGIHLSNGVASEDAEHDNHEKFEHVCLGCSEEFGPKLADNNQTAMTIDDDYREMMEPTVAASGRKSVDNGDTVALTLRGQTLDFAYNAAAAFLEVTESSLRSKYHHLNPGQQRMCLGNLLRRAK